MAEVRGGSFVLTLASRPPCRGAEQAGGSRVGTVVVAARAARFSTPMPSSCDCPAIGSASGNLTTISALNVLRRRLAGGQA